MTEPKNPISDALNPDPDRERRALAERYGLADSTGKPIIRPFTRQRTKPRLVVVNADKQSKTDPK